MSPTIATELPHYLVSFERESQPDCLLKDPRLRHDRYCLALLSAARGIMVRDRGEEVSVKLDGSTLLGMVPMQAFTRDVSIAQHQPAPSSRTHAEK